MTKQLDFMSGFAFGAGAMKTDGAPVDVQLANCQPTFWFRPLDGNAIRDLADEGVDITGILAAIGRVTKGEAAEVQHAGAAAADDDVLARVRSNNDQARAIVRRLIARWEGLKRADGSPIECNDETMQGLAGYAEMVVLTIIGGMTVARELQGNSASSSAGKPTPISGPAGELTDETALPQA